MLQYQYTENLTKTKVDKLYFKHMSTEIGRNDPCPCGSGKKYKKCCKEKTVSGLYYAPIKKCIICIYDKAGNALPVDNRLSLIFEKKDGDVQVNHIKEILEKYNLSKGLETISTFSRWIYFNNKDGFGAAAHNDLATGVIITQFALAYLASLMILSGADEIQKGELTRNTLIALCNVYSNKLTQPELANPVQKEGYPNEYKMISLMVRMYYEQMLGYQFNAKNLLSRNIILFNEIIKRVKPKKIDDLFDIFQKEFGLSISEYLIIGFAFFAGAKNKSTFSVSYLADSHISQLEGILSEKKVLSFLNIMSASLEEFAETDNAYNLGLDPAFTKTRFNVLFKYPLLKIESIDNTNSYLMPNIIAYVYKTFGGLYWIFHDYFEKSTKHIDFRMYFGEVFEDYVGIILKGIYGKNSVFPEISYKKMGAKFVDWYVEKEDKIILFEAKAYQFALLSRQTAEIDLLIKKELIKIAEAVEQVYNKILDISKYDELKKFRNKKMVPVIVLYEIPLASTCIYKAEIYKILKDIEGSKGLTGLADFDYHLVGIDELELFDEVANKIEIETIFDELKINPSSGFIPIMLKINDNKSLKNKCLDEVYNNFWKDNFKISDTI